MLEKVNTGGRRSPARWPLRVMLICVLVASVKAQCSRPELLGNVELSSEDLSKSDFPEGSTVSFQCSLGYVTESGNRRITCTNGVWSELRLKCMKKPCGSPGEVLNGMFDFSDGTDYGAIVRISCNKGYTLVGKDSILCTENGWNERLPTCDAVKCEDPPQIKDGRIVWRPDREFPHYNDVIQYQCNSGYILSGPSEIVCGADGEYNSPPPRCEAPRTTTTTVTTTTKGHEEYKTTNSNKTPVIVTVVLVLVFALVIGVIFYRYRKNKGEYRTREEDQKPADGLL